VEAGGVEKNASGATTHVREDCQCHLFQSLRFGVRRPILLSANLACRSVVVLSKRRSGRELD
jgi:hypothetical protein